MKIYNTLTGKKEDFHPIAGNDVKMYACGITVSGEAHIGHAYQALIYDIIRKYLKQRGYNVTYARNYTDVDDKIINKANETGIPADKYAEMMIGKIDEVMAKFDVDDPDIWLKATRNIGNIIDFISALIEKGNAYATVDGSVYFSVESFPSYGKLSNRNIENMLDGVRIDNDEQKRSPLDFALWKSAKPGEIFWQSPWGKGRPGWHIECSAMNRQAFGEQIDIHGGGRDLIFPHHENEIAQSEALTGKPFARYWIHNGLIKVNGQKMSKSLGNFILLDDLLKKYHREAIKFCLLSNSYRNDINLSDSLFKTAEKQLYDFYKVIDMAKGMEAKGVCQDIRDDFYAAMDDDFNTSKALSNLFQYFKTAKSKLAAGDASGADVVETVRGIYNILGLFKEDSGEFIKYYEQKQSSLIPENVREMAERMQFARSEKNWAVADGLRAEITALGYEVKISKDGCEIIKK
ncbi:MAG: cysteine--tRNA ligase [Christensenellaceae bacterium]